MTKGAISLSLTFDTGELGKMCDELCSAVAELPFIPTELEAELRRFLANPLSYFEVNRSDGGGTSNRQYAFIPETRFHELLEQTEKIQRRPDMQFLKRLSERVDRLEDTP